LRAETAILGATTCFDINNGAEVDLVPFEMLTNTIGPGEEIENVRRGIEVEQPQAFLARNGIAREDTARELVDSVVIPNPG
jgi:hypothetical protein